MKDENKLPKPVARSERAREFFESFKKQSRSIGQFDRIAARVVSAAKRSNRTSRYFPSAASLWASSFACIALQYTLSAATVFRWPPHISMHSPLVRLRSGNEPKYTICEIAARAAHSSAFGPLGYIGGRRERESGGQRGCIAGRPFGCSCGPYSSLHMVCACRTLQRRLPFDDRWWGMATHCSAAAEATESRSARCLVHHFPDRAPDQRNAADRPAVISHFHALLRINIART